MVEVGVFLPASNKGYIVSIAAPQYPPSYAMCHCPRRTPTPA
jgi:hypothetical protein